MTHAPSSPHALSGDLIALSRSPVTTFGNDRYIKNRFDPLPKIYTNVNINLTNMEQLTDLKANRPKSNTTL